MDSSRVFQSSWQTPEGTQFPGDGRYRRGNMGYHKYDQVGYTSHNFVGIKKDKSLRFAPLIGQVNPKSQEFNSNLLNPQIECLKSPMFSHQNGSVLWMVKKKLVFGNLI